MKHRRHVALLVFLVSVAGCFKLQPVAGLEPRVGEVVAFDITDMGRVQLGGSMGPEIRQVEGRLLDAENGDYLLGVTSVKTLRRGTQVWSGERVRISKLHVARTYERRFSRGRTLVAGAVAAGAFVLVFGKSLGINWTGDNPLPPKPDTSGTLVPRGR
jgi:hypothetical protein